MRVKTILCFSIILCIGIAGRLLWGVLTQRTAAPIPKETRIRETQAPLTHRPSADTAPDFQNAEFYRTIRDNNIFRPLGWTPTVPREPYRWIGTILPRRANTPPQAVSQTTDGQTTHIVSPGENRDSHTEGVSIESKQGVLETDGKQPTLRLHIRY